MIEELIEQLRVRYEFSPIKNFIFPLLLLVIAVATMISFYPKTIRATVHTTCKYQYFVISPGKFTAGTAIVFCRLADGRIVSEHKTAPWLPPAIDADIEIDIPQ